MLKKSRSRKGAGLETELPASPPAMPAETPAGSETAPAAPGTSTTVRRPRVRRKPPVTAPRSAREAIRTVDERLKDLADVPSLKQPPPEIEAVPLVDASAPPPPAPVIEPTAGGFVDRGAPIPEHYGMDRLVVLPRDPAWVFVYWELSGWLMERLRRQHPPEMLDSSRWVLRVHTLHEAPCSFAGGGAASASAVADSQTGGPYLVNVDVSAGQWYLRTASDTRVVVELGFVNPEGVFVGVLRGNEASTPRPGSSNVMDERWAIQRAELETLLRVSGAAEVCARATGGPGSEGAPRFLRSEQPRALGLFSSYLAEMERSAAARVPAEP